MEGRLAGQTAIVTGGSVGIGRAVVERFVREGATVVVADIQGDKGKELEQAFPQRVLYQECDVRVENELLQAVHLAESNFGRLDIMYHNAATTGSQDALDQLSVDDWDDSQAILVRASFLAVKVAVPSMRKNGGGSIVLTSSTAAVNLSSDIAIPYAVGKSAVITLTRMAALHYAKEMIRVNSIIPGVIPTTLAPMKAGYDKELAEKMVPHLGELLYKRFQPLPEAGRPDDIAAAAAFLASDEARFITGIGLRVDGGLSLERRISQRERAEALEEAAVRARLEADT